MGKFSLAIVGSVLLALAGCGKSETTTITDTAGNKATVTKDGGTVTYEGSKGESATMKTDGKGGGTMTTQTDEGEQKITAGSSLTEADLGIAFYPGSAEKEGASLKTDTPQGTSRLAVRTTADSPGKVITHYKAMVKEPNTMSASGGGTENEILTGKLDNGATIQITATREKGATETLVSVMVTTTAQK